MRNKSVNEFFSFFSVSALDEYEFHEKKSEKGLSNLVPTLGFSLERRMG